VSAIARFVQSRYDRGLLTAEQVQALVLTGKITQEEANEIINPDA
jgi:hypothetical protein